MAKEKVIIFEGEHNFVSPKNYIVDEKTGVKSIVPSEMNLVEPIRGTQDEVIEPPKEPDAPATPTAPTTTNVPTGSGTGGGLVLPVTLGDPTQLVQPPQEPDAPKKILTPDMPINFGVAPSTVRPSGGGGGGGGGAKEQQAKPKTFLQKYWWILVVVGIGGVIYYRRKK